MIMRMHHFGMVTDNLEDAVKTYETHGFKVFKRFTKPGMKAVMMLKNDAGVEFFEFDNPNSKLANVIKRHSAFESDDLEGDVQKYLENGYELAIPIEKGIVTKRYAYVKDKAGNSIELLEPADDMRA